MLSNAMSLAVELGVYDQLDGSTFGSREARPEVWGSKGYRERASRIQYLLPVYLAQQDLVCEGFLLYAKVLSNSLSRSQPFNIIRNWRTVHFSH